MATALIDTGSRMDDVIFEEFGAGSADHPGPQARGQAHLPGDRHQPVRHPEGRTAGGGKRPHQDLDPAQGAEPPSAGKRWTCCSTSSTSPTATRVPASLNRVNPRRSAKHSGTGGWEKAAASLPRPVRDLFSEQEETTPLYEYMCLECGAEFNWCSGPGGGRGPLPRMRERPAESRSPVSLVSAGGAADCARAEVKNRLFRAVSPASSLVIIGSSLGG